MGGRIVGVDGKPLKTELHHWWPIGLSKLWADEEGMVNRLSWDGSVVRSQPARFGAITNAHHILLEGPWAGTVEPIFDRADATLPDVVRALETVRPKPSIFRRSFASRLIPTPLSDDQRSILGEGLAALIIRSPGHRHYLKRSIQGAQKRMGFPAGYKFDNNLIAGNIHQHFPMFKSTMERGGTAVLLHTQAHEFIMGEGYLHNIRGTSHQEAFRCLLPLTPNLAVLLFKDLRPNAEGYCVSIALTDAEVETINRITQIYTKDSVYFRNRKPTIETFFAEREFRQLARHSQELIDDLMAASVRGHVA